MANDIRARLYDGAGVYFFGVNYMDLSQGIVKLPLRGWVGDMSIIDGVKYKAGIFGLEKALNQNILRVYTPTCTADLGDAKCKYDLPSKTYPGTVGTVTSKRLFTTSGVTHNSDNEFQHGWVQFTSGLNAGLPKMEIKSSTAASSTIELYLSATFDMAAGDSFNIAVGCDKRPQTCYENFNNVENNESDPFLTGSKALWNHPSMV